ncbi:Hypothetical predicted protein [Paramuricea clavata]|uniref:Uncharacterized protein n=1 Tax=Paramuricea clavata TaxID=317549 RepID=A0A7D9EAH2_PARCT|nr:Hypothetical predicted protein [Paramuricea clavata]
MVHEEYVTFGWIDKRCKQAMGFHNKIIGGKSLILFGDPGQLPPVADKPLYHAKPSSASGEQGFKLTECDASDDGMHCYLHSIFTVQKAQSSNRKYFNCIVQGNDRPVRAVCYSPEKKAELKALAATKSPVKMRNFKQVDTSDDIIITKWTKMTPLEKDQITFPYSDELAASTSGEPIK